ncbi:Ski-Sno domain-containing protein [Aphelenchoides fujianensis]|nr:Ski-Sno domain-containing protein [Aphelenchoides fujianensis]
MFPVVEGLNGSGNGGVALDLANGSLTPANRCEFFEFLGEKIAYFCMNGKRMVCLLQIYELFLKQLVGGLHTIYTKMRRLNIHPVVCSVEQVRALRLVGAIQTGVNRCKLIDLCDLERLFVDCSDTRPRPGRPPRRTFNCGFLPRTDLAQPLQNGEIGTAMPPLNMETNENGGAAAIPNVPDSLSFFTNFLPINPPNHLLHEVFAATVLQQLPHAPASNPADGQPPNGDGGGEKTEDCPQTLTNDGGRTSSSDEKQDSASNSSTGSNKPSGSNSETDDSFDREKSMSATMDQDSSTQGTASPNSQGLQFLLNKLISLTETTESSFKSHCDRLNELSNQLHEQIHEIMDRERSSRLELYLQRQKTAMYQRRYLSGRYSRCACCQRRRRKHAISAAN